MENSNKAIGEELALGIYEKNTSKINDENQITLLMKSVILL